MQCRMHVARCHTWAEGALSEKPLCNAVTFVEMCWKKQQPVLQTNFFLYKAVGKLIEKWIGGSKTIQNIHLALCSAAQCNPKGSPT